jgi:arsenite transporter
MIMASMQYLGFPLVAGVVTRYGVWYLTSKAFLQNRFLPLFSPLSLIGLLYTILVMLAYQGHHIVHNLQHVLRVFVPMVLYFFIMWTSVFYSVYYLTRRESGRKNKIFGYEMAVAQAFTASSNNFVSVNVAVLMIYFLTAC